MVKFDKVHLLLGLVLIVTLVGAPTKADGPVCGVGEPDKFNKLLFPKDFIWGTATAAFQVEGAVDEGCRGPSMWDTFIKKYPHKCQNHNADVAVDFYHRYKEDIKLMKDLNTNGFRFSISWSRIFPHGRMSKGINKVGVQFYRSLIKELKANGITPLVTLFHWDTPQDLEDEYGGFLSSRIIQDFTEYANFIFNEFGDEVKHWITFNEPWVFSRAGYDVGKKAPGRCSSYIKKDCEDGRSGFEVYQVSHNLLLAHADAVQAFRKNCEKCAGGKIGIAHSPAWFEPEDLKAAGDSIDRVLDFILGWHLDPTTKGDYPQSMKDRIGHRLPKFTKAEKKKLTNSTDFVGMNYYTSFFAANIIPDPKSPSWTSDSRVEWESKRPDGYKIGSSPAGGKLDVYSKGLRNLLKHIKENYYNPEVIITENGYGEELGEHHNDLDRGTNDYNRKYYLQKHLYSLNQAICEDKVNVTGYFVWSLLDNFEWQDGYNARFGLYFIDFQKNLTRHQKASGKWYSDFLKPQFPKLPTSSPNDEL